jgi:hypothetical protein
VLRFEGLEGRFRGLADRLENLETDMGEIKSRPSSIESTVARIENDHGQKLGALFDGYKLNSEKLDRIEAKVAEHEEIILRRIR